MDSILNREELLGRLDGDEAFLAELVALFLNDQPRLVSGIRQAVSAGDAPALARAAHTLKGSVSNFCAPAATAAAARLERASQAGDWPAIPSAVQQLEALLDQLARELTQLAGAAA